MNKYGRELELIILLTSETPLTALQMSERLGITRRNLYYYLDYLKSCGFRIIKSGTHYQLDRSASFFRRLHENIAVTEREAEYLLRLLDGVPGQDSTAASVRVKLSRAYGLADITNPEVRKTVNRNVSALKNAIAARRVVRLCSYSSPHSSTVSDRLVEPFLLMDNGQEVRCHDLGSHTNKTFKVARMKDVEMMDVEWMYEKEHKQVYTDVFMFSGEERRRVELRLGQLSHNLLVEEYPASESCITDDGGHWIFAADVVSFHAVGRFVLGLYDDISILGSDEFKAYVNEKISRMRSH